MRDSNIYKYLKEGSFDDRNQKQLEPWEIGIKSMYGSISKMQGLLSAEQEFISSLKQKVKEIN